jgi:hypothetical protein
MIVTIQLEQEDFNAMHDVILNVLDIKPTNAQIHVIWEKLPEDIRATAIQWGTNDTVFRDNLYEWLKNNYTYEHK